MPDLFIRGAQFLRDKIKDAGALRSVTMVDNECHPTLSVTFDAAPGYTEWEEDDFENVVRRYESRDWIVDVTLLVDDDDVRVLPKVGWIITDSLDGSRYACVAPKNNAWKWVDTGHTSVRIHTTLLDHQE